MDKKELEEILAQSDETDLPILITAKEEAKRKVQDSPTPAALASLDKASKMLKEYLADHQDQDSQDPKHEQSEPYEESKKGSDVLRWLKASGYQVEKTKFYIDTREGYLKSNKDGVFTKRLVTKYANKLPRVSTGKTDTQEKTDLGQQKQEEEISKLRLHNKKAKFEFDVEQGKYLPMEEFDRELAARLVVLDTGLDRMIRENVSKVIHLAGGDQKNNEHVVKFLSTAKDELLNSYATTKTFHVLIMPTKTGEAKNHKDEAPQ